MVSKNKMIYIAVIDCLHPVIYHNLFLIIILICYLTKHQLVKSHFAITFTLVHCGVHLALNSALGSR